jgi:DNA-binding transcriptional MerR regulator
VLTVEELAATSGETVRTIRFYQSEGVLPPPVRQGREVRYDDAHVARLRLISELQRRGLRLTAIRELLASAPSGALTGEWLGLGETLVGPWSEDRPVVLDEASLLERVGGDADAGAIDLLIEAGVVERRGDTTPVVYFVPSPGLLDVAVATAKAGLSGDVAVRLRDLMQRRLQNLATELVAEFTELVSVERLSEEGPGGLADLLTTLRPLTRRTVDLLFVHEMERAQRELLEEMTQ